MLKLSSIIMVTLAIVGCTTANNSTNNFEKLQGEWVSKSDTNWRITFHENIVISVYDYLELESCVFELSEKPCDTVYYEGSATFIKTLCDTNFCWEVTGLSEYILACRETGTGRLQVFEKVKRSPKNIPTT